MSGRPGSAIDGAKEQLRPRLVALRRHLIDEEIWPGVEFFRGVLVELERAESEHDLQRIFTFQLGVSGPLARAAGFSAEAIAMLDAILAEAQQIALTFSVGTEHPH